MELADRNLWDRFKEARSQGLPGIPRDELLGYMEETAEALDLMNREYQLQHLDIKPQNIFLVFNHAKSPTSASSRTSKATRPRSRAASRPSTRLPKPSTATSAVFPISIVSELSTRNCSPGSGRSRVPRFATSSCST